MADGSQVSRAVLQKRRHFELWGICIKLAVRKKHKHVFFDSFQANHFSGLGFSSSIRGEMYALVFTD